MYFTFFGACWLFKWLELFKKRALSFIIILISSVNAPIRNSNILRRQLVAVKAADLVLSVYKRYHHFRTLGCSHVHFLLFLFCGRRKSAGRRSEAKAKTEDRTPNRKRNEDASARDADEWAVSCCNVVRFFNYVLFLLMMFLRWGLTKCIFYCYAQHFFLISRRFEFE